MVDLTAIRARLEAGHYSLASSTDIAELLDEVECLQTDVISQKQKKGYVSELYTATLEERDAAVARTQELETAVRECIAADSAIARGADRSGRPLGPSVRGLVRVSGPREHGGDQ